MRMPAVNKLRSQIATLNGVGDLEKLAQSVERIPALIDEHAGAYEAKKQALAAEKAARKIEITAQKERLVAEAEGLIDSVNWKATTERLKQLLEEWKSSAFG
jgi:hypothetical protein